MERHYAICKDSHPRRFSQAARSHSHSAATPFEVPRGNLVVAPVDGSVDGSDDESGVGLEPGPQLPPPSAGRRWRASPSLLERSPDRVVSEGLLEGDGRPLVEQDTHQRSVVARSRLLAANSITA